MAERVQKQLDYASNVREQRHDKDTKSVFEWLYRNSKHFARMPYDLLFSISQQTFVVPNVQGGGLYRKGEALINRNIKPKVLMIVYEGEVRQCKLIPEVQNIKKRIGSFYERGLQSN